MLTNILTYLLLAGPVAIATSLGLQLKVKWTPATQAAQTLEAFRSLDEYGFMSSTLIFKWASGAGMIKTIGQMKDGLYCAGVGSDEGSCSGMIGVIKSELLRRSLDILISNNYFLPAIEFSREKSRQELSLLRRLTGHKLQPEKCPFERWHSVYEIEASNTHPVIAAGLACELDDINSTMVVVPEDPDLQKALWDIAIESTDLFMPLFDETRKIRRIIHSTLKDVEQLKHVNAFCQVPGNAFRHAHTNNQRHTPVTNWAASLTLKNPEYSTVNEAQEPADSKQKPNIPKKQAGDADIIEDEDASFEDYLSWAPPPDAHLSDLTKEKKAMAKLGGGTLWFLSEETRKTSIGDGSSLCETASPGRTTSGGEKLWCLSQLVNDLPSYLREILSVNLTSPETSEKVRRFRKAVASIGRLYNNRWNSLSINSRIIGTAYSQSATPPSLQLAFPFELLTQHIIPIAIKEEFMHAINATEEVLQSVMRHDTIRDMTKLPRTAEYLNNLTLSNWDIPSSFSGQGLLRWDYRPLSKHLIPVVELSPTREELGVSITTKSFVRSIRSFAMSNLEGDNWAFKVADLHIIVDPRRRKDLQLALNLLTDLPPGIRLYIIFQSTDNANRAAYCSLGDMIVTGPSELTPIEKWLSKLMRSTDIQQDLPTQNHPECQEIAKLLALSSLPTSSIIVNGRILTYKDLTTNAIRDWISVTIKNDIQTLAISLMMKFASFADASDIEGSGLLDRVTSSAELRSFLSQSSTPGSSFTQIEQLISDSAAMPSLTDFFLATSLPSFDHQLPFSILDPQGNQENNTPDRVERRWAAVKKPIYVDGYYLTLSESFGNVTSPVRSDDKPTTLIVWLILDVDHLDISELENIQLEHLVEDLPRRLPLDTHIRLSIIKNQRLCSPGNGLKAGDLDSLLCAQPLPAEIRHRTAATQLIVGSNVLTDTLRPEDYKLAAQERIDKAVRSALKRLPSLVALQASMLKKAAIFCHTHTMQKSLKMPPLCPQSFYHALSQSQYSPAEKQHAAFLWWQFLTSDILTGYFDDKLIEESAAEHQLFSLASVRPLRLSAAWDTDTGSIIRLKALVDPLSKWGQYIVSSLAYLHTYLKVDVQILLNPKWSYQELPINRWSRHVLAPPISFGTFSNMTIANFQHIVTDETLVAAVETPPHWHVESRERVVDMDNVRAQDLSKEGEMASYELKGFFMEGKTRGYTKDDLSVQRQETRDLSERQETRDLTERRDFIGGNALRLRPAARCSLEKNHTCVRKRHTYKDETISMSTPNYFQFKVPLIGTQEISLINNRSVPTEQLNDEEKTDTKTFDLTLIKIQGDKYTTTDHASIEMKSFAAQSVTLDILGTPVSDAWPKLWTSLKDFWRPAKIERQIDEETVNIFSLASGHMYERLLRIMIMSVKRHTNRKLKFWILENFLSDQFREKADVIAKKYDNISFEYVSYKWPPFLRPQTEKQRQIWANKILFLDVLFPLNLKRVIYVDADQIVRGDIGQLWDMDLNDRVYGFTPFCNDKDETAQFRFWDKGYWRDHLAGKAYHISALFVVDLDLFRQRQVGTKLRAIYNALSRDPHSLANLDQDLPNYAQDSIPIFSLPQEWLWCETWCSDGSKLKAKTIDLCNNPLTHESKLTQARRIVPEWIEYDNELDTLLNKRPQASDRRTIHTATKDEL